MAVYQTLSISLISQDQEKNCSKVHILWKSTQTGASYNMVEATGTYNVYVNGQEYREDVRYVLPKQTEQIILEKELMAYHDSKGEALIEVETWMDTKISAGEVKLYEKLRLPTIPRVSQVLASDSLIGKYSRLAVSRKNSAYSHSIAWSFGSQSGYLREDGESSQEEQVFAKESLDFYIPDSFYREIPNQKSALCTLTICTYDNGILVGEPQSTRFTVTADETVCGPALSGIVVDINDAAVQLTGDNRTLIKHISTARCTVFPQAKKGASIVQKTVCGKEVEESLDIDGVQLEYIPFTATDSRGFTADFVAWVDMIPYVPVSCEAVAERHSPVSGDATLRISGNYYPGSFGVADNEISVCYSIGTGERIPVEVTVLPDNRYSAEVTLSGMDYTRLYNITLWVSDLLTSVEKRTTLKKGVPVFDWGEADFAFHVPVKMDMPLPVASGGTGGVTPETIWQNLGFRLNMEPGVEYATWEMWDGKPVFTKLVNYGPMPNSGSYGMLHHCSATKILRCFGSTSDGRTLPYGNRINLYCDLSSVYLDTQQDESGHTAQVQLYYIKN